MLNRQDAKEGREIDRQDAKHAKEEERLTAKTQSTQRGEIEA